MSGVSSQKVVENGGTRAFDSLVASMRKEVTGFGKRGKKIAKEDPRKVAHGLKVGTALVLVSLLYYLDPLYDTLGVSATWVRATLGKGLNRMIATCLGGFLGVGACHLALLSGNNIAETFILLFFCFIVGAIVTFMRFFPELKTRHDYGLVIFLLSFSLATVSGYREDVLSVASKRLSTVIIGCFIAISVCIFVCPVWSGSELHSLIASNIDILGSFMEGLANEYLDGSEDEKTKRDKSFLFAHKKVLATKTNEETMAEPEARDRIKGMIKNLSSETGKTLEELSRCINKMETPLSVETHMTKIKALADELRELLQSVGFRDGINPLDVLPVATVVSLLIDTVTCVEKVTVAVHELCILARFKRANVVHDQAIEEVDKKLGCPVLKANEREIDVVVD